MIEPTLTLPPRFIIFCLSTGWEESQLDLLKKSNKQAFASVAKVLRLTEDDAHSLVVNTKDMKEHL